MKMRQVFERILECFECGEACMLVSAVGGEGSVPRKSKSHMLVTKQGRLCGTVGGGAVEGKSIQLAMQMLEKCESALKPFELHEKAADGIGMICGGRVEIYFCCISPDDASIRDAIAAAVSQYELGENAWLMINLESGSLTLFAGEKMHGAQPSVPAECIIASEVQRIVWDETPYYMEQLVSDAKVLIFGGGHVAQALVPVLASVGFRCEVIEDRAEFCDPSLFPGAHSVRHVPADQWESAIHIGPQDYVCIMTRGHAYDLDCQALALHTQACYIGVIGSRKKKDSVNARLKKMGFDEQDLARIHTPIGLEIGAVTPAEIAVSIAAQMIAHRASLSKEPAIRICMA